MAVMKFWQYCVQSWQTCGTAQVGPNRVFPRYKKTSMLFD
jgi:hypothetical protein